MENRSIINKHLFLNIPSPILYFLFLVWYYWGVSGGDIIITVGFTFLLILNLIIIMVIYLGFLGKKLFISAIIGLIIGGLISFLIFQGIEHHKRVTIHTHVEETPL